MIGKSIHSNVSVHVASKLTIFGWTFIYPRFNIYPPLNLDFFNSEQLIFKKNENPNFSRVIFELDTSMDRNLHLFGLKEKHFNYTTKNVFVSYFKNRSIHTLLLDQI